MLHAASPSPSPAPGFDGDLGIGFTSLWVIALLSWLVMTLIPIVVAQRRGVVNKAPTIVLSVLLSWTCIGFLIALIVAVSSRTRAQVEYAAAVQAQQYAAWQAAQAHGQRMPPPPVP